MVSWVVAKVPIPRTHPRKPQKSISSRRSRSVAALWLWTLLCNKVCSIYVLLHGAWCFKELQPQGFIAYSSNGYSCTAGRSITSVIASSLPLHFCYHLMFVYSAYLRMFMSCLILKFIQTKTKADSSLFISTIRMTKLCHL